MFQSSLITALIKASTITWVMKREVGLGIISTPCFSSSIHQVTTLSLKPGKLALSQANLLEQPALINLLQKYKFILIYFITHNSYYISIYQKQKTHKNIKLFFDIYVRTFKLPQIYDRRL